MTKIYYVDMPQGIKRRLEVTKDGDMYIYINREYEEASDEKDNSKL